MRISSGLLTLAFAVCTIAGCHSDASLAGDWFRCGNVSVPDSSCGDGIHLAEDYTWNEIIGGAPVSTIPYHASIAPDRSGSWEADWTAGGSVAILLITREGERASMTEGMSYSVEGDMMVGPSCLMDCSGRPIHWFRARPSRLAGFL